MTSSPCVGVRGLACLLGLAVSVMLAAPAAAAQSAPVRVVQSGDGTLLVVQGTGAWTLVPDPIADADLAGLNPVGELDGALNPQAESLHVVQASDGNLYALTSQAAWTLVPDQIADTDLAALAVQGELDGSIPSTVLAGQAPAGSSPPAPPQPPAQPPVAAAAPVVQPKQFAAPPPMSISPTRHYVATLETSMGTMQADLFASEAPITVNNFVFLARQGFYDGVAFHRVIQNFMIQTGDPTGTGTGGPGYRFNDEPVKRPYVRGTLAMANAGPNTNGSQFFIVQKDYPLPPNYTIFGKLTAGLDVLDAIAAAPTGPGRGGSNTPLSPITLNRVTIGES